MSFFILLISNKILFINNTEWENYRKNDHELKTNFYNLCHRSKKFN